MPRPSVEAERREQILDAACVVLAERGLQALRVADVAREAGVSAGTVHYYFESKKDVVAAAFEYNFAHSLARRADILAADHAPLESLHAVVESYLPTDPAATRAWMVWAELWTEGARDASLAAVNERLYGQWRDIVTELIARAQRDGTASDGDAAVFANTLVGLVDGLAVQVLLHSRVMDVALMRTTVHAYIDDVIRR